MVGQSKAYSDGELADLRWVTQSCNPPSSVIAREMYVSGSEECLHRTRQTVKNYSLAGVLGSEREGIQMDKKTKYIACVGRRIREGPTLIVT